MPSSRRSLPPSRHRCRRGDGDGTQRLVGGRRPAGAAATCARDRQRGLVSTPGPISPPRRARSSRYGWRIPQTSCQLKSESAASASSAASAIREQQRCNRQPAVGAAQQERDRARVLSEPCRRPPHAHAGDGRELGHGQQQPARLVDHEQPRPAGRHDLAVDLRQRPPAQPPAGREPGGARQRHQQPDADRRGGRDQHGDGGQGALAGDRCRRRAGGHGAAGGGWCGAGVRFWLARHRRASAYACRR